MSGQTRKAKASHRGKKQMKTIHVTVTPKGQPSGKDVPVTIAGQNVKGGEIQLNANTEYDIVFNLTAANGVRSWGDNPFGCQANGTCPGANEGASAPFSVKGTSQAKLTVHVDPTGKDSRSEYRLNYNDELTTDPVIVIGVNIVDNG